MIQFWFAFLDGFAAASALIAAFFVVLTLMTSRSHNLALHYLGQCDVAMHEPRFANPELGKLDLGAKTFDGKTKEFERYEWYVARLVHALDAAMRMAPWQQWGAVTKTQLANHQDYFASDYYARRNYLAHYSPRMRRLIAKQRPA